MAGIVEKLQSLTVKTEKDCYLYCGRVNRAGYDKITEEFRSKQHDSAYLFISTYGGDPHAGYRIARAFRHHYSHLTVIISTFCKSAGTLLAIGADELVIADKGELGPLDMQIKKPDELFDMSSGLDITQSMAFLRTQSSEILKRTVVELKVELEMTTKTAAEIGTKLAQGLVSPIYAQIDPYKIGELQRAVSIAFSYGKRLNEKVHNLRDADDSLRSLVLDYPSHGFVIDRKEASTLFNKVRAPSDDEQEVINDLYNICKDPDQRDPFAFIVRLPDQQQEDHDVPVEPGAVAAPVGAQPEAANEADEPGEADGRPGQGAD